jgi:hypothetical protein
MTALQWDSFIPLKLRQWVNALGTSDYECATISPDHAFLALLNSSKSFISIYELREGRPTYNFSQKRRCPVYSSTNALATQLLKVSALGDYKDLW